jgi:hypothetical protein
MLSATCTKHGTGISIWGDEDDFRELYQLLHKLSGESHWTDDAKGGRIRILDSFAYEVRHTSQERRLSRPVEVTPGVHFTDQGFNYSWIDMMFTLACLRFNAAYTPTDQSDQDQLNHLELLVKQALYQFDSKGALEIEKLIGPHVLNVNHEWVWQFNQQIEIDYMEMTVNKTRFRKIPYLLKQTEYWSPTHSWLISKIERTATALGCDVFEIEYLEYPKIKW